MRKYSASFRKANSRHFTAQPDSPEVRNYLSTLLGKQQAIMEAYLKKLAGASIKRGGMAPAGNEAPESLLRKQAIETVAREHTNAFDKAMEYAKYAKESDYRQYLNKQKQRQEFRQMQQDGARSRSASHNHTSNLDDIAKLLNQFRSDAESKQKTIADLENRLNMTKQQADATRAAELERARDLDLFNRLAYKAGLTTSVGKQGANWTAQDDYLMDYIGVKLGFLKPWDRKINRK